MVIDYTETLPAVESFQRLFDTAGWSSLFHASPDELDEALRHSWYSVWAHASGKLVGGGRIISDGVLYATIHDLIVISSYRRRGIGSEILRRLVEKCREAGIRTVQLFSAAGMAEFYKKRGFERRAQDAPGMQLRMKT
jgi:N-acetylglutamate synthase-like GNAT family acetyltransferase